MAVERIEEFTLDLANLVKTRTDTFVNTRNKLQQKIEADFQRRVSEEGLSYASQLDYRKKQLASEETKMYPDEDFISEIKSGVSYLNKMVRYEKIRKEYLDSFTQWKEGTILIDSLIDVLQRQLNSETDPVMVTEIQDRLSTAKIAKASSEKQVIENRIALAQTDKSESLIDTVLSEVEKKRNDALLINDQETAGYYEVKISALTNLRQEISSQNKVMDIDLKVAKDGLSASKKLAILDNALSTADKSSPITINNQRYASEYEYWDFVKNQYLAGTGGGSFRDFFGEFGNEVIDTINTKSLQNQFGSVPYDTISSVSQDYDSLKNKTGFENYANKIEVEKMNNVSEAIGKTAQGIIAESALMGNWDSGIEALKSLQTRFGIDTSAYIADLYLKQLTFEPETADQAMRLAEFRAAQKGTTPEEELAKIVQLPIEAKIVPGVEEGEGAVKKEETKATLQQQIIDTQNKIAELEKQKPTATTTPSQVTTPTAATVEKDQWNYAYDSSGVKRQYYGKKSDADVWFNKMGYTSSPVTATAAKTTTPVITDTSGGRLPLVDTGATTVKQPVVHIVKSGETLWGISQKYGYKPTKVEEVMDWAKGWGYAGEAESLPLGYKLNITPK